MEQTKEQYINSVINDIKNNKIKEILEQQGDPYVTTILDRLRQYGLVSKSFNVCEGKGQMYIELPTKIDQSSFITREAVEFFIRFSGIPIPCTNPIYIEYYLKTLSNYYDVELWNLFVADLKLFGMSFIRHELNNVKTFIINEITSNNEYQQFCTRQLEIPQIETKNEIYNVENIGKYFISIDIKSANFTFLKCMCPSINIEWKNLMGCY